MSRGLSATCTLKLECLRFPESLDYKLLASIIFLLLWKRIRAATQTAIMTSMLVLHIWAVIGAIFMQLHVSGAAIVTSGCWRGDCLTRNDVGAICFVPRSATVALPTSCTNDPLSNLLRIHIDSSVAFSVAYYNEYGEYLGSANWSLPLPLSIPVFLCMSGSRHDVAQSYRTVCRTALHDDDQLDASAHIQECAIDAGQNLVRDGCSNIANSGFAQPREPTGLDQPWLVHAFFVLGALVTVGAIVGFALQIRKHWHIPEHFNVFVWTPCRNLPIVLKHSFRSYLLWRQRQPSTDVESSGNAGSLELPVIVATPYTPNIRA